MSRDSHRRVIAIDGPAAAGKTTVALALADRLGVIFLDTGLLYRAVTYAALQAGIDPGDQDRLVPFVRNLEIGIRPASVADGRVVDLLVDGVDITPHLRDAIVDRNVSQISAHAGVRAELLPVQRRLAENAAIVIVGRDIGSVVVPDAGVKIYLDASLRERARRRFEELQAKGSTLDFETVLADLTKRDAADSGRDVAPLSIPEGATIVESDGLDIDAVVSRIADIVTTAWAAEPEISR